MKKKLFITFLISLLAILVVPVSTALADDNINSGTSGVFYDLGLRSDGEVIYVNTTDVVEFTGGLGKNVIINCAVADANLVISNVVIESDSPLIKYTSGANNTLLLMGDNLLNCTSDYPALYIIANDIAPITGLAINALDDASLIASGGPGGGPGIGCDYEDTGDYITITINSGEINATGGTGAAGIGGSNNSCAPEIIINGGTVTATGGDSAAGIGGGITNNGIVSIYGGTVTATGGDGYEDSTGEVYGGGAGLGGGADGYGEVNIYGGTVNAIGGTYNDGGWYCSGGAGIGGGDNGDGVVYITGGTVDAFSGVDIGGGYREGGAAAIGSGCESSYAYIEIENATVNATGCEYGAGIGGGDYCDGEVYLTNSNVTAVGGYGAAGIGGGYDGIGHVDISGGTTHATGGDEAAGIGGGCNEISGGDATVYINGGTVTAIAGNYGAGIGGGYGGDSYVEISNATVTAAGGDGSSSTGSGAGIGGGNLGNATIYITDSTVTAYGGVYNQSSWYYYGSAGIGGGNSGNAEIYINGGTINAYSGIDVGIDYREGGAAAIGSGCDSTLGFVDISNATVNATGCEYGAGIGGGDYSDGEVYLTNSSVTAVGGYNAAGIGGGYDGSGYVEISGGTVHSTGGEEAAGIGGGHYDGGSSYGIVSITGGTVTAIAGDYAAGIGGGPSGYGMVNIGGNATVYATAGYDGAGIGGGEGGAGYVYIDSSTVETFAVIGSEAGIGSGYYASSGEVEITNSFVIARGGYEPGESAAGIGGGHGSNFSSTIYILDSIVYAQAGSDLADDIGGGLNGTFAGPATIEGNSAVFMFNDNICTIDGVLLTTHTHVDHETIASNEAYGFHDFPDDWNTRTGYGYLMPVTITYNHNHTPPADEDLVVEYVGAVIEKPSPNPSRAGYVFNGWHKNDDGTDPIYFGSTTAQSSETFYADWVLMGTDSGKLSGELCNNSGAGASGCNITLESQPITVTTDTNGDFSFGSVYFVNHTLIVRNSSGNIVKEYAITFTEGSTASAVVNDIAGTIDITYTGDVTGVIIPLQLNGAEDDAVVDGNVRFTYASSGSVANPQTSDASINYIWFAAAIVLLLCAMAAVVISKKQNVK